MRTDFVIWDFVRFLPLYGELFIIRCSSYHLAFGVVSVLEALSDTPVFSESSGIVLHLNFWDSLVVTITSISIGFLPIF